MDIVGIYYIIFKYKLDMFTVSCYFKISKD